MKKLPVSAKRILWSHDTGKIDLDKDKKEVVLDYSRTFHVRGQVVEGPRDQVNSKKTVSRAPCFIILPSIS